MLTFPGELLKEQTKEIKMKNNRIYNFQFKTRKKFSLILRQQQ